MHHNRSLKTYENASLQCNFNDVIITKFRPVIIRPQETDLFNDINT